MKKQVHTYYSGRVQGVGFRFTVREIASQLNVYGWVKNLPEGRVEVLAEAEEDILKNFLEQINKSFSRYIEDINTEWIPAAGEFRDFTIAF